LKLVNFIAKINALG